MTPLFTVITVTYNAAAVVERTLQSVLRQTVEDIEYIIVDGRSTDDTLAIVQRYATLTDDLRSQGYHHAVTTIVSEPDSGIYDAMNKGIRLAHGRFLCFLNAGDTFHTPTTLADLLTAAENATESSTNDSTADLPVVIYGQTQLTDLAGHDLGPRRLSAPERLTWRSFRRGMVVCHQSFIVRCEAAQADAYDLRYRYSADVDWCIRVMHHAQQQHPSTPVEKVLLNSRLIIADYLSEGTTTAHRWDSLKERFHIMRRHYGFPVTLLNHLWFIFRLVLKR